MRLATILGLRHDKWVAIAGGNAAEIRPQYKALDPADLQGISEVQYFDTDGLRSKRKIRHDEVAEASPPKKARISRK